MDTFIEWMRSVGLQADCCTFADIAPYGRSVVAARDILRGEVVIQVPDNAVLLPDASCIAEELEDAGLVHGECNALLEGYALALALLAEKAHGNSSRWAGYIDMLPKELPGLPLNWTAAERSMLLQGTAVLQQLLGLHLLPDSEDLQRAEPPCAFPVAWAEFVHPFIEEHGPKLWGCGTKQQSLASFKWALSVVSAYAFTLGDDQYQGLVPMWDALNHITGQVNVRLNHDAKQGVLQMIATVDIPKGGQVINNFGAHSPSSLLLHYGFVEQLAHIPHSYADIPLTDMLQAALKAAQPSALCTARAPSSDAAPAGAGWQSGTGVMGDAHDDLQEVPFWLDGAAQPLWAQGCRARFKFLLKHHFVDRRGCYSVGRDSLSHEEFLEAMRLLCLTQQELGSWRRALNQWHVPMAPPLQACKDLPHLEAAVEAATALVNEKVTALSRSGSRDAAREVNGHEESPPISTTQTQGLTASARQWMSNLVREHELGHLRHLQSYLATLTPATAAAACRAAWRRRL